MENCLVERFFVKNQFVQEIMTNGVLEDLAVELEQASGPITCCSVVVDLWGATGVLDLVEWSFHRAMDWWWSWAAQMLWVNSIITEDPRGLVTVAFHVVLYVR